MNQHPRVDNESAIRLIATKLETKTGDNYFRLLVSELALLADAEVVFIAELTGCDEKAQTIAIYSALGPAENFEYGIENSPGSHQTSQVCIYPGNVQELFPDDYLLADLSVDGYGATGLWSDTGSLIGYMVIMFQKPVPDPLQLNRILDFFSIRTAVELEHRLYVKELRKTENYFKCLAEQLGDVIFVTDNNFRIKYISTVSEHFFGMKPDEMNGKNLLHFFTDDCVQLAAQELEKMLSNNLPLQGLSLRTKNLSGGTRVVELKAVSSIRVEEMPEMVGVISEKTLHD